MKHSTRSVSQMTDLKNSHELMKYFQRKKKHWKCLLFERWLLTIAIHAACKPVGTCILWSSGGQWPWSETAFLLFIRLRKPCATQLCSLFKIHFLRILPKQNSALLSTVCVSVRPCTGVISHLIFLQQCIPDQTKADNITKRLVFHWDFCTGHLHDHPSLTTWPS